MIGKSKSFRTATVLVTACLTLVTVGCSKDGPKLYTVAGPVTFNGEPVKEGRIIFRMEGGSGQSYSAPITDGSYKVEAEPGPAVVEITASRLIPGKFDNSNGTPEPMGEMYIPKEFNSASTLKASIDKKSNTIPFELTSTKR